MTTSTVKTNLLGLTQPEMEKFFDSFVVMRLRSFKFMYCFYLIGFD
ncbi:23S rRNA (adenine(2503)-C(2))-methyltransferase RlmN, partial [Pseudomonas sp. NPDC098747]